MCTQLHDLNSKFWMSYYVWNPRSWLGFCQNDIWDTIEQIVIEINEKWQYLETTSSMMFKLCYWPNPSRDLVFEISILFKTLSKVYFRVWRAYKTAPLTSIQHTVPPLLLLLVHQIIRPSYRPVVDKRLFDKK